MREIGQPNACRVLRWLCLALLAGDLLAQFDDFGGNTYGPVPTGIKRAAARDAANRDRYKDDADVLVLPGLVADRKQKRVEILAECTGVQGNAAVEFLLVDRTSSHGYESLMWSYAKPSSVHEALEFIEMDDGQSYDVTKLQFWPEGERVVVTVIEWDDGPEGEPVRLEKLLVDRTTEETVSEDGFVFTGSMSVPDPEAPSSLVYAADLYEPKSIASMFNTPVTVLDVPRQALQGDVYDQYRVNPDYEQAGGKLMLLVIEPEHKDGRKRVRNLLLTVANAPGNGIATASSVSSNSALSRVQAVLTDEQDQPVTGETGVGAVVESLVSISARGEDPYVSIRFDGDLPLESVRKVCVLLRVMETTAGIKVQPPVDGQLYYKVFDPDPTWREPGGRPSQPWEVWLSNTSNRVSGQLALNETVFGDAASPPEMRRVTRDIFTPQDLRRALDDDAARRVKDGSQAPPAVLLIFAARRLTYGTLLEFIGPAMTTHDMVHVFLL